MTDDERCLAWLVIAAHIAGDDDVGDLVPNTIKHHLLTRGWWEIIEGTHHDVRISEVGHKMIQREGARFGC